jgi:cell division protein FtsB
MKNVFIAFFVLGFLLPSQTSFAQLSKEEIKEWKDKAKDYKKNPAALKAVFDERDMLRRENAEMEDKADMLEAENRKMESRVTSLQDEIDQLNDQLLATTDMLNAQAEEEPEEGEFQIGEDMITGIVFKVQIGAYRERRLDDSMDTSNDLSLEAEGGMQKIVIGQFRDFQKAEQLQRYMQEIGIKDAWVVSYRDGNRIPLEEARGLSND